MKNRRFLLMTMLFLIMILSFTLAACQQPEPPSNNTGNKIIPNTLKIDLAEKTSLDCVGDEYYQSIKDNQAAIFNYDNWEPGYMDVTALSISNKESFAIKWSAKFVSDYELSALTNVIDVYVKVSNSDFGITVRDEVVANWEHVGTVKDFVNTIKTVINDTLAIGESKYLGIALVMAKDAGNEYQGMSICGDFDIRILADQQTS